MELEFDDSGLERIATDASFSGGWPPAIVKLLRKRIQQIVSAADERDLFALRSLKFKRLKGNRSHQHAMWLNRQWRLIIEIDNTSNPQTVIKIIRIEDYH